MRVREKWGYASLVHCRSISDVAFHVQPSRVSRSGYTSAVNVMMLLRARDPHLT